MTTSILTSESDLDRKNPRILIVDDDKDACIFYTECLVDRGFYVTTVNDPFEALSSFKPSYYDLVIIDIRMPKMNGFELYERMKKLDNQLRVCFITAFEEYYSYIKEQFRLDVQCFIRKPVTAKDLIKNIYSEITRKN